eukprot:maker-scaffold775_size99154-snap-gene-0.17 protein:Tk07858 transcript:maker-scaffold775_size99154-snap-gene-0.17-mRNA-1 annotation:"multispecies: rna polymerase sigma70 factor"
MQNQPQKHCCIDQCHNLRKEARVRQWLYRCNVTVVFQFLNGRGKLWQRERQNEHVNVELNKEVCLAKHELKSQSGKNNYWRRKTRIQTCMKSMAPERQNGVKDSFVSFDLK